MCKVCSTQAKITVDPKMPAVEVGDVLWELSSLVGYSHRFDGQAGGHEAQNEWVSWMHVLLQGTNTFWYVTIDFCWTQGFWRVVSDDDHWRWLMTWFVLRGTGKVGSNWCDAWMVRDWDMLITCYNLQQWVPAKCGFIGTTLLNKGVGLLGYIYIVILIYFYM